MHGDSLPIPRACLTFVLGLTIVAKLAALDSLSALGLAALVVELVVIVALWTRYAGWAALATIVLVAAGLGLRAWHAMQGAAFDCGCAGAIEINGTGHLMFGSLVVLLAWTALPRPAAAAT